MPLAILMLLCPVIAQQGVESPVAHPLSSDAFLREFEKAFEHDDSERMATLVSENQTRFVPLFEKYGQLWIDVEGEPGESALRALARARALANAVDTALEAPGLLEMVEVLEGFDDAKRKRWHLGRLAQQQGEVAFLRSSWNEALGPLGRAEDAFAELDWLPALASVRNSIGSCHLSLGQYLQAIECHEKSLATCQRIGNRLVLAHSLQNLGRSHFALGQYEKALECHEQSCLLYEAIGHREDLAWSIQSLGRCRFSLGQYEQAIECHERSLALSEQIGNRPLIAHSLANLGRCYERLEQYEKALEYHEQSRSLYERIGNREDIAWSLANIGNCYSDLGQHEKAIEHNEQSRALFEEIGNTQGIAAALSNLGVGFYRLGQFDRAIAYDEQSLGLRKATSNAQDIAVSLNNLGLCYQALGKYEKAIGYHEQGLALREKIGNPQDVAGSLNNLGVCYAFLGQYGKALGFHERVVAIAPKIENPDPVGHSLNLLGDCYFNLGQYEKAIEYLEKSLALFAKVGNQQAIATALNDLGACHADLGHDQKAIENYEKSLALSERLGDQRNIAVALGNLGFCCEHLGQHEKAIAYQEQSLALKERIGMEQSIAYSLGNLGISHNSLGRHEKALGYYERSLALWEKLGNPRMLANSLMQLAAFLQALGQHEASLARIEACVAQIARIERNVLSQEGRSAFFAQWAELPAMISSIASTLSSKLGEPAVARGFPLVESLLARTTLEGLQERAEGVLASQDPELSREREHTLNTMVEQRLALVRETQENETRKAEHRAAIAETEKMLEGIDQRLRQKNPRLREIVSPQPASLARVQAVLGKASALLLFVLGAEQSYVWVVTTDHAQVLSLAGEAAIRVPFARLSIALGGERPTLDEHFVAPARELFRLLLADAWPLIAGKQDLVIVPDGFLGFLPFEVLLTDDIGEQERLDFARLPYLLRHRTVRYAPSASLLVWFAEHRTPGEESWRKDMFLFGDPLYASEPGTSDALAGRAALALVPETFQRLKQTLAEVKGLAEKHIDDSEAKLFLELRELKRSGQVCGKRFDLFVGNQASKANLQKDLTGYRIVHLAVHGFFDTDYPWFSGLVLSTGSDSGSGFLNTIEIASLDLDAQIVFLSACDTAKGKLVKADGIRNTARAFLLAGAKSVIATQWTVRDEAAPIVAQTFYDRLFSGDTPAQALREAKLALIEHRAGRRGATTLDSNDYDRRFAHPSFWAPFILWGG